MPRTNPIVVALLGLDPIAPKTGNVSPSKTAPLRTVLSSYCSGE